MSESQLVHGTCVSLDEIAVLLRGPSGSGKSDLALRLVDRGARLVSDDQTRLVRVADRLIASAPPAIAGFIEVRGIGPVPMTVEEGAWLRLVVDLMPSRDIERLPEENGISLLGLRLPRVSIDAFTASAAAKVRLAVRLVASHRMLPS
jgi:serine kinase of HPr protein (carbohydrate metabolism regulator)